MKYYVVKLVNNGVITVVSEWSDDLNSAKVSFFDTCKTLCNAADVITGYVAIVDSQLNTVANYKEVIRHEAVAAKTTKTTTTTK